jgi:hypothetical protein
LIERNHIALLEKGTRFEKVYEDGEKLAVQVTSGYYMGNTCWITEAAFKAGQ